MLEETPFGWRDYFNQTTLHPLGALAIVVLGLATIILPRRHALLPTLVLVCFVPAAQRVVVAGLDFTLLRLMVVFGGFRILLRGEHRWLRWQRGDTIIVAWAFVHMVSYTLSRGSSQAVIQSLGEMFEALGLYFFVRCILRGWDDVWSFSRALIPVSIIVSLGFLNEFYTGRNLFAVFGGVPEYTVIRDGKLRCQGAFPHPILAGCFWAAMTPVIAAGFWRKGANWIGPSLGVAASITIILTTASSTPIFALAAGLAAALMFSMRSWTKHLRWTVFAVLVGLHFAMKAPVWHLISRVDAVGGSTGWYRYKLIDTTIRRFSEWALVGVKSTAGWFLSGNEDVPNRYVLECVQSGLLGFLLFMAMIWACFAGIGRAWRAVAPDRRRMILTWLLGVSLFTHCVAFIGAAYWGQVTFGWYFTLGAIVSLQSVVSRRTVSAAHRRVRPVQRNPRGVLQPPAGVG